MYGFPDGHKQLGFITNQHTKVGGWGANFIAQKYFFAFCPFSISLTLRIGLGRQLKVLWRILITEEEGVCHCGVVWFQDKGKGAGSEHISSSSSSSTSSSSSPSTSSPLSTSPSPLPTTASSSSSSSSSLFSSKGRIRARYTQSLLHPGFYNWVKLSKFEEQRTPLKKQQLAETCCLLSEQLPVCPKK